MIDDQLTMVTKLERKRLRAELIKDEEGNEDFFVFQARCIRKFDLAAGAYIRQLVFWDGKGRDPEGWIYKSENEMELEIGLSRRQQRGARKVLTSYEVLEEKRKDLPRRLYYRVDLEKLVEVLKTPGSTLNQWKRGMQKDPETGKFYRPESETLNLSYSEDGITDPASEDGTTDPASEDGTTDRAITENTYTENLRGTTEDTLKSSSKEFPFQGATDAKNRATSPPEINKSSQSNEGKDSTTPFSDQDNVDPKLVREVRRAMKNGIHSPVALAHYQTGRINIETVAEFVSQDALGNVDFSGVLLPAARVVLKESRVGVAS